MKNNRRNFLRTAGAASLSLAALGQTSADAKPVPAPDTRLDLSSPDGPTADAGISLIGDYGPWAAGIVGDKIPGLSFRNSQYTSIDTWRPTARKALQGRLGIPDAGGTPTVTTVKQYTYDGLHIEELTWQLPYGRPTAGIFLKPAD